MSAFFLADDLSGALDAAAAFHHAGQEVTIALSLEAWPLPRPGRIVGFTTETRNASTGEAAAAVQRAIRHGAGHGGQLVYKKIDSTLRGPVAAELTALADSMPKARILFAPANPSVGRTVQDGVLLVNSVPVAETEFGRDPVAPVRESKIAALLGNTATSRVEIPDTRTSEDLATAVARVAASGAPWVAVGSGALARPVAQWLRTASAASAGSPRPAVAAAEQPRAGGLFLCGSAHPKNREQLSVLRREKRVAVHEVKVDDGEARAVAALAPALRGSGVAALMVEGQRGDSRAIVRRLAALAGAAVRQGQVGRLFITGGETAFAVCRELGVATLDFESEIESGLCVARGGATSVGTLRLAIKPGGFGDARTWLRAYDTLLG